MTSAGIVIRSFRAQRLACVGPAKRLGQDGVEVLDEVREALLERLQRIKGASFERSTREDAEPDLHLIQPGCMTRCVNKADSVSRCFEERLAGLHASENTAFTLHSEVIIDAASLRHEPDEPLGLVGVELVCDEDPCRIGIEIHRLRDVCDKVLFCSRRTDRWRDGLASHHIEVRDEAERAVPLVLELDALGETRSRRQRRMEPLERLDACLLISADDVASLLVNRLRVGIGLADLANVGVVQLGIFEFIL